MCAGKNAEMFITGVQHVALLRFYVIIIQSEPGTVVNLCNVLVTGNTTQPVEKKFEVILICPLLWFFSQNSQTRYHHPQLYFVSLENV